MMEWKEGQGLKFTPKVHNVKKSTLITFFYNVYLVSGTSFINARGQLHALHQVHTAMSCDDDDA